MTAIQMPSVPGSSTPMAPGLLDAEDITFFFYGRLSDE
jgi:hypothetical protein